MKAGKQNKLEFLESIISITMQKNFKYYAIDCMCYRCANATQVACAIDSVSMVPPC